MLSMLIHFRKGADRVWSLEIKMAPHSKPVYLHPVYHTRQPLKATLEIPVFTIHALSEILDCGVFRGRLCRGTGITYIINENGGARNLG